MDQPKEHPRPAPRAGQTPAKRPIVLIAGAGASLAHARALGCATEKEPPLDRTFLRNPQGWSPSTSEWFRNSVQTYLGDDDLSNYRMEEVFSYAYADTQWHELRAERRGLTDEALRTLAVSADFLEKLIHNFQLALAMTTNELACGPTDGALGPVLRRLLDLKDGQVVVPASSAKSRRDQSVPLSERLATLLSAYRPRDTGPADTIVPAGAFPNSLTFHRDIEAAGVARHDDQETVVD